METRTPQEAKKWLRQQNITISEWARQNGFAYMEVFRVLNGQSKMSYGKGREVALKLNIAVPE